MNITKVNNLACPLDDALLSHQEKQLICTNGHSFDIAKQGYVNLLPVQQKRSKEPGDSKEMVVARTLFLNSGFYEPIAKRLTDIIVTHINTQMNSSNCMLDAGCGEGYYFDFILKSLETIPGDNTLSFIGLDISKHAVIAASKRNKKITWLVGTNRQPPIIENSVDIIVCIFGFQSFEGFNKILKTGGIIILVEPGPNHLKELRDVIYTNVKKADPADFTQVEQHGFLVVSNEQLQFTTGEINNGLINNLLLMTPHFFRANKDGREAATKLQKLNLSVDVVYRVLKKV